MELSSENDLSNCMNVLSETFVEQESLRDLKFVKVLQNGLDLAFKYLVELLGFLVL